MAGAAAADPEAHAVLSDEGSLISDAAPAAADLMRSGALWAGSAGACWLAAGDEGCGPGTDAFALALAWGVACFGGFLCRRAGLPALVGMLAAGAALRQVGGEDVEASDDASERCRAAALAVILSRAGSGLDLEKLRLNAAAALALALLPATTEAATVAVASHYALGLPALWAVSLGYLVAAVSPAVVVPGLLNLQEQGFGRESGVPSLVIAAASVDDVYAIAGFSAAMDAALGDANDPWMTAAETVGELVGGVVVGTLTGVSLARCTAPQRVSWERRGAALLVGAVLLLFGGKELEASGGGALAVLCFSAAAAHTWGAESAKDAAVLLNYVWVWAAQPLLFALVGAEVRPKDVRSSSVAVGLVVLVVGLIARFGAAFGAAGASGSLVWKERLFVAAAWIPKATVQAALAGIPLDRVRDRQEDGIGDDDDEDRARTLLALGVAVIVVTAPLGAVAIAKLGPRLLRHGEALDSC